MSQFRIRAPYNLPGQRENSIDSSHFADLILLAHNQLISPQLTEHRSFQLRRDSVLFRPNSTMNAFVRISIGLSQFPEVSNGGVGLR